MFKFCIMWLIKEKIKKWIWYLYYFNRWMALWMEWEWKKRRIKNWGKVVEITYSSIKGINAYN